MNYFPNYTIYFWLIFVSFYTLGLSNCFAWNYKNLKAEWSQRLLKDPLKLWCPLLMGYLCSCRTLSLIFRQTCRYFKLIGFSAQGNCFLFLILIIFPEGSWQASVNQKENGWKQNLKVTEFVSTRPLH